MANPNPSPATRFKPGNKANLAGRPPGRSITARLRELTEETKLGDTKIKDGKQVADLLSEVIVKQALKGDFRFVQLLLDRLEGQASHNLENPPAVSVSVDAIPAILAAPFRETAARLALDLMGSAHSQPEENI